MFHRDERSCAFFVRIILVGMLVAILFGLIRLVVGMLVIVWLLVVRLVAIVALLIFSIEPSIFANIVDKLIVV